MRIILYRKPDMEISELLEDSVSIWEHGNRFQEAFLLRPQPRLLVFLKPSLLFR